MKKNKASNLQSGLLAVMAGVFCLALSAAVWAEEAKPCAGDVEKFCKGVEPGQGRIAKCMKEHEEELTPACKARIAKVSQKVRQVMRACKEDVEKECKDVEPGGGRKLSCLKAHEDTLSPRCREKMESVREKA